MVAGLEAPVVEALVDRKNDDTKTLKRIIYVSCGFEALKRDLKALTAGGWKVIHAEAHVLFPGSDHLETLAVFDRL